MRFWLQVAGWLVVYVVTAWLIAAAVTSPLRPRNREREER